jgi:hypothetical protein
LEILALFRLKTPEALVNVKVALADEGEGYTAGMVLKVGSSQAVPLTLSA